MHSGAGAGAAAANRVMRGGAGSKDAAPMTIVEVRGSSPGDCSNDPGDPEQIDAFAQALNLKLQKKAQMTNADGSPGGTTDY
jgi:hypothetical protein